MSSNYHTTTMVDSKSHNSAATSIESIKGETNKTEKESSLNWVEKLKEKLRICFRLILMVCVLLHCIMFIVGVVRFNSCPANKNITFYLVAAGIIGAIAKLITLIKYSLNETLQFIKKLETTFYAVELVLFIFGSQWVFNIFEKTCEKGYIDSCDKTTYHLAFWILIIYYALITFSILLFSVFITSTWLLSVLRMKQDNDSQ